MPSHTSTESDVGPQRCRECLQSQYSTWVEWHCAQLPCRSTRGGSATEWNLWTARDPRWVCKLYPLLVSLSHTYIVASRHHGPLSRNKL